MKVLFIAPLPDPVTGQSLACSTLLDKLVKEHQVTVIDIGRAGLSSGDSSLDRAIQTVGFAWRAYRAAPHADVVYFTISESVLGVIKDSLIYLSCWRRLDRMVVHLHGGAGMRKIMRARGLIARICRLFLERVGAVVLLGERHLDIVKDLTRTDHVHLIPNCAQKEVFIPIAEIGGKFSRRDRLRVLYLSNLIPSKGYMELVSGFEALSGQEQERIELTFAGAFESKVAREEFLSRLSSLPSLKFNGVVAGVAKAALLKQSHVLCLPTYYPYEGQPICILEAYAAGCAVVTTDHSGIFDIFTPAVNGFEVGPRSATDIASALRYCLVSWEEMEAVARRNRDVAQARYTETVFTSRVAELLMQVAGISA